MSQHEKTIRIAYIIGKMWAGGVESVVFNYYRAIDHKRFQFDFFYDEDSTVEPPQDIIDMGARFIKLPPYQKLVQYLSVLRKQLREGRYQIVHSHLNTLSVFPLYAAWREHVPIRIAHNHSVPGGNEWKRNFLKTFLKGFSKLFSTDYFACSEKAGRWMFGDKTFDLGRVHILKNAVDFNRFRTPDSEIEKLKTELGISDKFVVGNVGRFTYAKNHSFLFDVFEEILKKNDKAVLLLVGDGELHDEILESIERRGLVDRVILTGKVQNPGKYYRLNDISIVPSIFEGLSLATIESQIAGVPVVISKAIPKEAVISDACVFMDIDESPERWAEAALRLANRKVVYTDAVKDYDIAIQAPKLTDWYTDALERISENRNSALMG